MFLSEAQLRCIIKEEITKRLRDSLIEKLKPHVGKGLYVHFSLLDKRPPCVQETTGTIRKVYTFFRLRRGS